MTESARSEMPTVRSDSDGKALTPGGKSRPSSEAMSVRRVLAAAGTQTTVVAVNHVAVNTDAEEELSVKDVDEEEVQRVNDEWQRRLSEEEERWRTSQRQLEERLRQERVELEELHKTQMDKLMETVRKLKMSSQESAEEVATMKDLVAKAQSKLAEAERAREEALKSLKATSNASMTAEEAIQKYIRDIDALKQQLEEVKRESRSHDEALEAAGRGLGDTRTLLASLRGEVQGMRRAVETASMQGQYDILALGKQLVAMHALYSPLTEDDVDSVAAAGSVSETLSAEYLREALKTMTAKNLALQRRSAVLHNELQTMKGSIRIYMRTRPLTSQEKGEDCTLVVKDDVSVGLLKDGKLRSFQFDRCFQGTASQASVFEQVSPVVLSAFDGYNVCVFAYGPTGSGKTFTMMGTEEDNRGIVPRTLEKLFELARERSATHSMKLRVSMLEIYNEQLNDLLGNGPAKLDIFSDEANVMSVSGLVTAEVQDVSQVPRSGARFALTFPAGHPPDQQWHGHTCRRANEPERRVISLTPHHDAVH